MVAGNFYLQQSQLICGNNTQATDGYFTTYYVINKIVFDKLEHKLGFEIEQDLKDQLSLLHENVPYYDFLDLRIYTPGTDHTVLQQKVEATFADLETVLIHMVNEQEDDLYANDMDFYKGQ